MNLAEATALKAKIDALKTKIERAKGALETQRKTAMNEFGVDTIEGLTAKIVEITASIDHEEELIRDKEAQVRVLMGTISA